MARKTSVIKTIIIAVLLWRIALLGVAAQADQLVNYDPSFPYAQDLLASTKLPRWLYSWGNFDGVHYLTIINKGYVGIGFIQAFFPVFPLIVKLLGSSLVAGLALNLVLLGGVLWLLYLLANLDLNEQQARWSLVALLLFPTSFFLGAFYSETLFLLLVLGGFYLARKKQWLAASLAAALASGTRVVGIFLWPALIYELWLQTKPQSLAIFWQTSRKELLTLTLAATGLIGYMVYLWQVFADPLYFFHVQSEFGAGRQESIILFPQVIWRYIKILWTTRPFDWKYFSYVQDLVLSLGALTALSGWYKKIRPSYLLFALLAFFLPTLTGTLSSMPRYILVIFPLFLLAGELMAKKSLWRAFVLTAGLILLIINTILFVQGYWVA